MGLILGTFLIFLALTNLWVLFCINKKLNELKNMEADQSAWIAHFKKELKEKIDHLSTEVHASTGNLKSCINGIKESTEQPKTTKANNWDSVREAFRGPSKVELNERN